MSCGSTICTSTIYDLPASQPVARFNWLWQSPFVLLNRVINACERRHQRRQLLELDDRLLADIGIARDRAVEEACKSGWIRVTMWRTYR
jgi:uncharacterized protein YjiS (DUF1127 family)